LIVFFPLYPVLIAAFNLIFRDYLFSAIFVSALASIALGLLFRKLVKLDYGEKTAQFSVLFLFIFPTSYFLHAPYTESLFIALAIGCFLAARTKCWLICGILGALACLTRINGIVLLPALLFEVWSEYRETGKFIRKWLALLIIAAGFAAYLSLNYWVAGDATMFLTYQREHWQKFLTFPWQGIWGAIGRVRFLAPNDGQMTGTQELVFAAIGLFATIAGWRVMRPSYRVWMSLNWLMFVSTSFLMSVPRYTLVLFPMFVLMATATRRNWWLGVVFVVWSILYLALFTSLYVRGWWAF
jgi:4-amino-4-deoxy-L-arabinose transferase-like glycosyltransferase